MKKFFEGMMVLLLGAFWACQEENKPNDIDKDSAYGCIMGTITFFNTGVVTDAYVRLLMPETFQTVYSSLLGQDGRYSIDNIDTGSYILKVYKSGFIDTIFPEAIHIYPKSLNKGECRQMDWAISKLPPRMNILYVNEDIPLDTLDFGTTDNRMYFRIYNGGSQTCIWSSDFKEVASIPANGWLKSMSPSGGNIKPGEMQIVSVEINRIALSIDSGASGVKFLIQSDNSGGCVLTVVVRK